MADPIKELASDGIARIRHFVGFFKAYMSVSSLITALLPIPITAFGVIETYKFQTKILATYTSLYCFLVLAFVFFSRHQLGRAMFRKLNSPRQRFWQKAVRLLPMLLIVGSLMFAFAYHEALRNSVSDKRTSVGLPASEVSDEVILERSFESKTPESTRLMIFYLGIFITAEGAFVLMAMREHLQDVLKLTEVELIKGCEPTTPNTV